MCIIFDFEDLEISLHKSSFWMKSPVRSLLNHRNTLSVIPVVIQYE